MRYDKFTQKAQEALAIAQELKEEYAGTSLEPELDNEYQKFLKWFGEEEEKKNE